MRLVAAPRHSRVRRYPRNSAHGETHGERAQQRVVLDGGSCKSLRRRHPPAVLSCAPWCSRIARFASHRAFSISLASTRSSLEELAADDGNVRITTDAHPSRAVSQQSTSASASAVASTVCGSNGRSDHTRDEPAISEQSSSHLRRCSRCSPALSVAAGAVEYNAACATRSCRRRARPLRTRSRFRQSRRARRELTTSYQRLRRPEQRELRRRRPCDQELAGIVQLEVAMQTRVVEFMDGPAMSGPAGGRDRRRQRSRSRGRDQRRFAADAFGWNRVSNRTRAVGESKVFLPIVCGTQRNTRDIHSSPAEGSSPPDLHTRQHTRTPLLHTPATREDTPLKSRHKHAHSDTPYHLLTLSHSAN